MPGWWRAAAGGIAIDVRLTPKGGADRIDGPAELAGGRAVLRVRVRAVPEKGKANAALERLIAGALGVAPGNVAVACGHRARIKTVQVSGDADTLGRLVSALEHKNGG